VRIASTSSRTSRRAPLRRPTEMLRLAWELSRACSSSTEVPSGVPCHAASPEQTKRGSSATIVPSSARTVTGPSSSNIAAANASHVGRSATIGSARSQKGKVSVRPPRRSSRRTQANPAMGSPSAPRATLARGTKPYVSHTAAIQPGDVKTLPSTPPTSSRQRRSTRGSTVTTATCPAVIDPPRSWASTPPARSRPSSWTAGRRH
jgi:hypothetical protein